MKKTAIIHKMVKVSDARCPACQKELAGGTEIALDGETVARGPLAGTMTCCMWCGQILVFDENLHMRFLTLEETKARRDGAAYKLLSKISMLVRNGAGPYSK